MYIRQLFNHELLTMIRYCVALLLAGLLSPVCSANLVISEVVDAPLPGGLPKFVEITNTGGSTVDLSGFSLGNVSNASTTMGFDALVLSGMLAPGDSHVVSYESGDTPGVSTFFDTYGFDADDLTPGSFINGDDRLVLFSGAALAGDDGTGGNIVDIYGVFGVDGTGEVWEYTDGYAFRNPDVTEGNDGAFDPSEWTFSGANGLETGDDTEELALILAETTPGTHAIIPEPTTVALALLSLAAVAGRKRS